MNGSIRRQSPTPPLLSPPVLSRLLSLARFSPLLGAPGYAWAAASIHPPPAARRAAMALDLVAAQCKLVVVLQLLPWLEVTRCVDDNVLVGARLAHLDDLRIAVGLARVVHEALRPRARGAAVSGTSGS
eukprot:1682299-Prymnesium_polylepis.1